MNVEDIRLRVLVLGDLGDLGQLRFDIFSNYPNGYELLRASDFAVDICESEACTRMLNQLAPDVVINAAACTKVDQAEKERVRAFAVNSVALISSGFTGLDR